MSPFRPRSHPSDCPGLLQNCGCSTTGHPHSSMCLGDGDIHTKKRQRRDSFSTTSESPKGFLKVPRFGSAQDDAFHSKSSRQFATTPAEFNLFQRQSSSTSTSAEFQLVEIEGQQEFHGWAYVHDLRSSAFWELHQSIVENGECLVRRMRDYESSRSHHRFRHHAKESKRRGRKQRSLGSKKPSTPSVSEASDEDDVLICSGDPSVEALCRNLHGRRSFDAMDVDGQGKDPSRSSEFILSGRFTDASIPDLETCGPQSSSSSSSINSWFLPHSSASRFERAYNVPETSTEKALTGLNVALASGAGSISDHSSVWANQNQFGTDSYDIADDLWH